MMNLLTGAETYAANQLFATLDTKTSLWNLNQGQSVLLSDTVGFVRDLPHHLVASFRATLEEAIPQVATRASSNSEGMVGVEGFEPPTSCSQSKARCTYSALFWGSDTA